VVDGRVRETWQEAPAETERRLERPKAGFESVGGMENLKEEIRLKIIYPLTHPEIYQAYGKAIGGGILMYGPPGCGKTHLARATAGEIKANFVAIGINDVLDMWIGSSERNLHELFEQARQNTPCVLFFDEVDALGGRRSDVQHGSARQLINQFLAELDGVETSNEGVLVLAATNAPWHLDPAFRRPGRFDRILFVPPPDAEARASILRILCRGKPVSEIDYDHLGKKTDHFSGADLKGVLDQAIEQKLRAAMKEGVPKPLATADLLSVIKAVKPTTREWFATARNYALYSNQGGVYDDILKYMKL
jgi:SpoVK/Ycf46/Vps4 family AAA+-type ATPase